MIAVDTNLLVHAHRRDSAWHQAASGILQDLAAGMEPWAVPWPCIHEFLGIVTHPRVFRDPTPMVLALDQIEAWLASPSAMLLAETPALLPELRSILIPSGVNGPRVHDAKIAAICLHHRVRELWTADRDFSRFASLVVKNPLVA